MRMQTNILNFIILVVLIYPLPHLITMLIQFLSICQDIGLRWSICQWGWNPPRLSRHFSMSWWLCQALAILRLVSLPFNKLLKHSRLLITLWFSLKMNQTPRFWFLHLSYTIPSLMSWRNPTQRAHMHNISGLPLSHLLARHSQENAHRQHLRAV